MVGRRWILLVGAALLALLATTWYGAAPKITQDFGIGIAAEPSLGTVELGEGAGFESGPPISNAFVAHDAATSGLAGRYSAGGTITGPDGSVTSYAVQFRHGPSASIQATGIERRIRTGAGKDWLHYTVAVDGAITPDGSQWLFRPEVHGHGPGGEFSVRASCRFLPMTRALVLTITERFHDETPRSYTLTFDVQHDGDLRWRAH